MNKVIDSKPRPFWAMSTDHSMVGTATSSFWHRSCHIFDCVDDEQNNALLAGFRFTRGRGQGKMGALQSHGSARSSNPGWET